MTPRAELVHTMCAQVDTGDAAGFASWFAPAATYRFGNGEPEKNTTARSSVASSSGRR